MKQPDLAALAAFAEVAREQSFRKAATVLGVSPSALSHGLRALESRLQVRLLNRTTRSVSLTEAGQRLLQRLGPALQDIDAALAELDDWRASPSGVLRITAPRPAVRLVLGTLTAQFLRRHPGVRVELSEDDALVNIAAEGLDAGVRFVEAVDRDMVAIPIGVGQRCVLVASPKYLARRGMPAHPRVLAQHDCLHYRFPDGRLARWALRRGGEAIDVEGQGALASSSLELLLQAAADGLGIALAFEADAAPLLRDGRLATLLDDWTGEQRHFHLYHASRRQMPAALRAFIDLARAPLPGQHG